MRLIPVLTALLVMVGLYAIVFEREAMFAFARGEEDSASSDQTSRSPQEAETQDETPSIGVVVIRSTAQQIDSAVILRGQTAADRQVEIRAETSSIVVSTPLDKGRFVKTGEVLCKLDPGSREASLAEARALFSEAQSWTPESKARVDEAQADWKRRGSISMLRKNS